MKIHLFVRPLAIFILAVMSPAFSFAQGTPPHVTASGWTTHSDPAGFSIDMPAGWVVTRDKAQGRITLKGLHGEQVIVWPLFVEQRRLDTAGAEALLLQLARKINDRMSWATADSSGNVVRTVARDDQRSGTTLMTWSSSSAGSTLRLFSVEAPSGVYRSSTDTFAAILKSFQVVPDSASKEAAPHRDADSPAFVNWTDPREGAFTMAVPRGWQVVGGAYRLSATDIRVGVTMISPGNEIRAFVGDSRIGVFTEPNQMLALGGLREGGFQTIGDGTKLEIRRYLSGKEFARIYIQSYVQPQCSGLQVESNNDRQDLALSFLQTARNEGSPGARITAGDIQFICSLNGSPAPGSVAVATSQPLPGRSPLWNVYRLYGYVAAPDSQVIAEKVSQRALQSWHINPDWQAQEAQIANSAVQQDNARSQQIRARAMQAIQDDQRKTSDMIVQGYQERSKVYDEISRRRENAILGTVDVVDPASGTQYKVDNYSDYHWMNDQGSTAGTRTETSPGPDWREMVTLP